MPDLLLFNDFVFDADARQLRRNDEAVELPAKAFDLLRILIDARPRALSQRELYDSLWPDTTVEIANLHKLVHQLRAALGDGSRAIIRTSHGYGFAFGGAAVAVPRSGETVPAARFELRIGRDRVLLPVGLHVVGRNLDSIIPAPTPAISRRHARLVVTETEVRLEDLGSRNGTSVNGKRLDGSVVLRDGDLVVFADLGVSFHAVGPPEPTQSVHGELKEERG